MPRKAEWTYRLAGILDELRALPPLQTTLDRSALEQLLDLSPRQALRVLQSLPGAHLVGKSLAIGRADLTAHLEALARAEPVQAERRRRGRVRQAIVELRGRKRAESIAIQELLPDAGLPDGMRLESGRLEIEFSSVEELLGKLLALARAVASDPERFTRPSAGAP